MIAYGKDEEGDLVMTVDDETLMGTYMKFQMGDDRGLEMMLRLADFYEDKGHNVRRLVDNYFRQKEVGKPVLRAGWGWSKLFNFFRGK